MTVSMMILPWYKSASKSGFGAALEVASREAISRRLSSPIDFSKGMTRSTSRVASALPGLGIAQKSRTAVTAISSLSKASNVSVIWVMAGAHLMIDMTASLDAKALASC